MISKTARFACRPDPLLPVRAVQRTLKGQSVRRPRHDGRRAAATAGGRTRPRPPRVGCRNRGEATPPVVRLCSPAGGFFWGALKWSSVLSLRGEEHLGTHQSDRDGIQTSSSRWCSKGAAQRSLVKAANPSHLGRTRDSRLPRAGSGGRVRRLRLQRRRQLRGRQHYGKLHHAGAVGCGRFMNQRRRANAI
jgi:hypothetical protein